MENASRALIMAGSVLIALMIIGALLLMFNNLTSYQDANTQNEREAQIVEFNNQYETYNRNDVRGSDLYTLLNKVIDYNRRKSTEGKGDDEGQYIAYQPMTISYSFNGKQQKLAYDENVGNKLFTGEYADFTLNEKTTNKLYKYFKEKLVKTYGNENDMLNLASGISNLYNKESDKDILSAIALWNKNVKSEYQVLGDTNTDKINNYKIIIDQDEYHIKDTIYTYYEYMQFKRAHFDCKKENVEYDRKTGRITKMEFEFNGKFN